MANFYLKRRGDTYYEYIDASANGTDERLARTQPMAMGSTNPVLISSQSSSHAFGSNDQKMSIRDLDITT